MRFFTVVLAILLLSTIVIAQQRYLVSPNDEVIPLNKNQKAAVEIMKRMEAHHRDGQAVSAAACGSVFTFGYTFGDFPPNSNFGAYHKDVLGQWYVGKATGTIDTLFWYQYDQVGALDSTLIIRIHRSVVGPDFGPGSPSTPYWRPPCQNWGYWPNSKDLDQGVAPFPEEAYPETAAWRSTINNAPGHPSTPPFGTVKWGYSGVSVHVHRNSTNFYRLPNLQVCSVKIGEKFFVDMKVHSLNTHVSDPRTEWFAWGDRVTTTDENYPSRNWKFYEHDSGPSNCSGVPVVKAKRGWVARGGFGADSQDVAAYNWWYVMTVSSNTPPQVTDKQIVYSTLDTGAQTVRAEVTDCNPAHPESAGVASVRINWTLNDVPQTPVTMDPIGGGIYQGDIPGCSPNSAINYKVQAFDLNGAMTNGAPHAYSVITMRNQYYYVDTGYTCTPKSIVATGTVIDTSAFFLPPYVGHGTATQDDGTAGPFEMTNGNMTLFGYDSLRYVWVGINGGISLSKGATDTIDVNANGYYASYRFPQPTVHHYRPDTVNVSSSTSNPPPWFVVPFWADLIYGDTSHLIQYGHIRHGYYDACQYVVEWDSMGNFDPNGSQSDIDVFRVVLNRCDGTIEFQYDNVGTRGNDSACTVGMQADSNAITGASGTVPWLMLNRNTYPYALKPRNNWCIKFYPGASYYANDGWNMVSVPVDPFDHNYTKTFLFPQSSSEAYKYDKKYSTATTMPPGPGYWLKFLNRPYAGVGGTPINDVTIPVTNGWNIVGSVFKPIVTGLIVKSGVTVKSKYFGYDGSTYIGNDQTSGTLMPGHAFWVKVGGTGTLEMIAPSAEPKLVPPVDEFAQFNKVIVRDAAGHYQTLYLGTEGMLKDALDMYELPPAAPDFDARFSSQRMVETYPATLDKKANYSYPITVQSNLYPITVEWNIVRPAEQKFLLTSTNGQLISVMEGHGSARITDSKTTSFSVRLGEANVPKVFALSENYPNPFNPTTHFTVDIPHVTDVEMVVFDLLGQKVTTLMSGQYAPGSYRIEWNGRDARGLSVPTGIYFVRLNATDEFTALRKVMLMK